MSDLEQCNLRVPGHARETLRRIARQVRDYETKDHKKALAFVAQLNRLLDEAVDPDVEAVFSRRLDKLENQMESLLQERPDTRRQARGRSWTVGEGSGRRLTPEGETELRRMVADGFSDTQIGRRLGIRAYAVNRKRQRIAETDPTG